MSQSGRIVPDVLTAEDMAAAESKVSALDGDFRLIEKRVKDGWGTWEEHDLHARLLRNKPRSKRGRPKKPSKARREDLAKRFLAAWHTNYSVHDRRKWNVARIIKKVKALYGIERAAAFVLLKQIREESE